MEWTSNRESEQQRENKRHWKMQARKENPAKAVAVLDRVEFNESLSLRFPSFLAIHFTTQISFSISSNHDENERKHFGS